MRYLLSILFLCASASVVAQQPQVIFDYDAAGNQIKRHLIDISDRQSSPNSKDFTEINESDLIPSDLFKDIKYYPNPVKEELYISWASAKDLTIKSIDLYTLNGKVVRSVNVQTGATQCVMPFRDLPSGVYAVHLLFSDGSNKNLKIIKNAD